MNKRSYIVALFISLSFLSIFADGQSPELDNNKSIESSGLHKEKSAKELTLLLRSGKTKNKEKVEIVKIIRTKILIECIDVLIEQINVMQVDIWEEIPPLEVMYPCVGALAAMGEPVVPKLATAIGEEKDALRLRLMCHTLVKVKTKNGALALLEEHLKASNITEARRKSLTEAKEEIDKAHKGQ